mmetsp:Transcript_26526/g.60047  ORF Transcript_26526/g.60047 Transcript_26526/m.60047 type:complete len:83 (+) Transcript_26526:832-1080(+)
MLNASCVMTYAQKSNNATEFFERHGFSAELADEYQEFVDCLVEFSGAVIMAAPVYPACPSLVEEKLRVRWDRAVLAARGASQ